MEEARGIFARVEEICILRFPHSVFHAPFVFHFFECAVLFFLSKEFPGDCLERQQSATRVACELV